MLSLADDLDNLGANRIEADGERLQALGGNPFTLVDQPEKDVFGSYVVVIEKARFFLGENHNSACSICEPFKHGTSLLSQYPHHRSERGTPRQYSDGHFLASHLSPFRRPVRR